MTRWQALQWKALLSKLEKDFDGLEQRSIFSRKQREGEFNASYLYDLLARISLSDSRLTEKAKIELIKSGLQPKVMWYLEDKRVATLEDLDFYLRAHDRMRQTIPVNTVQVPLTKSRAEKRRTVGKTHNSVRKTP